MISDNERSDEDSRLDEAPNGESKMDTTSSANFGSPNLGVTNHLVEGVEIFVESSPAGKSSERRISKIQKCKKK